MAEPAAVTQQDFELFKQEIKHENQLFQEGINNKFELYLSELDKKIETVIDNRLGKITKWVVGLFTVFVVAFFTYFEFIRTRIDQINDDRMARVESALARMVLAPKGTSEIAWQTDTKDSKRKTAIIPTGGKSRKVGR